LRDDNIIVPHGETVIEAGDAAVVIGSVENVREFAGTLTPEPGLEDAEEIVIVGGTEIGYQTARLFEAEGLEPRLVERDPERARELAEKLPRTLVLQSDATDIDFLVREHVDESDIVVAAVEGDERNLLISLLAKRIGVERTIGIVEAGEYVDLFETVGIDVGVNPRLVTAEEITRFTRKRQTENVAMLESDRAEVLEIEVGSESVLAGARIRDTMADLPDGIVIGAITRDGELITPRGDQSRERRSRGRLRRYRGTERGHFGPVTDRLTRRRRLDRQPRAHCEAPREVEPRRRPSRRDSSPSRSARSSGSTGTPSSRERVPPSLKVGPVRLAQAVVPNEVCGHRRESLAVLRWAFVVAVDRPLMVSLNDQHRLAVGDVAGFALLTGDPADLVGLVRVDQRVVRALEFERIVKDPGPDRPEGGTAPTASVRDSHTSVSPDQSADRSRSAVWGCRRIQEHGVEGAPANPDASSSHQLSPPPSGSRISVSTRVSRWTLASVRAKSRFAIWVSPCR